MQRSRSDDVFKALADPSRRQLLDSLQANGGQNLRDLCAGLDMARQSVSKHLRILEGVELVVTVRRGRETLHHLNAAPINDIAERWIARYHRTHAGALAGLKKILENPMTPTPLATTFVYRTYIRTTPEMLWRGLTDPAFTRSYWGLELRSEWTTGSTVTWIERGVEIADPAQVVLEHVPFTRLSYTWHTFTPEWADANGIDGDLQTTLAAEQRSKVTFEIDDVSDERSAMVRLTVTHDDFEPGSTARTMVEEGWPRVASDLKTLLESLR